MPVLLMILGVQSVLVPGQLCYLSEERIAFGNIPLFSRARRMFVMANRSTEDAVRFEWHVTSNKDSQVYTVMNCHLLIERFLVWLQASRKK